MSEEKQPSGVLVVEDNPVNATVNRLMLERMGVPVVVARNGRQALEELKNHRFRLVLMDISMPEMDGVEATRIIRSGKEEHIDANTPIVALTAHTLDGDETEFRQAGMDQVLSKPVSLDQLQTVVRKYFTE